MDIYSRPQETIAIVGVGGGCTVYSVHCTVTATKSNQYDKKYKREMHD